MTEPTNHQEYLDRFHANQKTTGYGIGNVFVHCPCPFCAAPEWLVFEVLDTERAMQRDTTCSACHRSAKALVKKTGGNFEFEVVQTGGPDQPDWLKPQMRRVDRP